MPWRHGGRRGGPSPPTTTRVLPLSEAIQCVPPVVRGFSPLDEELALLPGTLTPSLVETAVRLGSWMPFPEGAKMLEYLIKVEVSEPTIRRDTQESGEAYVEIQSAEVEVLEKELPEAPEGPPLQQLSVDGAYVPLVHKGWAEVKTLAIGTVGEAVLEGGQWQVHSRELSYFSRMAEHETFSRLATVETHRRGTEKAGKVCAVVDGAEWEQKFIDMHRPDAVRILDWGHGAGYMAKAGQGIFGAGTAATSEWVGVQLHELKHGEPGKVLGELRRIGEEMARVGDSVGSLEEVKGALEYLEKRQEQIRYAYFQAMGYPIGSGMVESANPSPEGVVEARLKGSGMHWAREHVDPMVALRNIVCSDRWEEAWPQISQRLREKARERSAKGRAQRVKAKGMREERVEVTTEDGGGPPLGEQEVVTLAETKGAVAEGGERPRSGERRPAANHPWRRMRIGQAVLAQRPSLVGAKT